MARHARVRAAGQPWHVRQRGVNRVPCFVVDGDRRLYLSLLAEHADRHAVSVHAYVLMPNHVHLLVTPADAFGVSRMMKDVGQRYVQSFNKKHRRTGTLWEGRFRSSIAESQRYVFTLYRYIESNPVRAGLVRHPRDFPWSSYQANAQGAASMLVKPNDLYLALSEDPQERLAEYRRLFGSPLDDDELLAIRCAVNSGRALGGPAHAWALNSSVGLAPMPLRERSVQVARAK